MDERNEEKPRRLSTSDASLWPVDGCLVFREVRESGGVTLTTQTQTVDILEAESLNKENEDIFTLSWESIVDSDAKCATCSLCNDQKTQNIILHKLKSDDYKLLRHLAEVLFSEYRCRLIAVAKDPLRLNCVLMDHASYLYLKTNIKEVVQLLHKMFDDTEVSIHLKGRITEVERYGMDSSLSCLPSSELLNFERRLKSQISAIETGYQRQRARYKEVTRLLEELKRKHDGQSVQTSSSRKELVRKKNDGHDAQREEKPLESLQKTACSVTVQSDMDEIVLSLEDFTDERKPKNNDYSEDVILLSEDISSSLTLQNNDDQGPLAEAVTEQDRSSEREENDKRATFYRKSAGPLPRAEGRDTVILLDLSSDVDKEETNFDLERMKKFVLDLIEEVEDISSRFDVHENIGLVTRSEKDWFTCLPNNDYNTIRSIIKKLTVGERVPLSETLRKGIEFTRTHGKDFIHSENKEMEPRIIILTNYAKEGKAGHFTDFLERDFILEALQLTPSLTLWIPFGNADRLYLMSLVQVTNAHLLDENAIDVICKCQLIQTTTGKIADFINNNSASLTGNFDRDLEFVMDIYTNGFDHSTKATVERIVRCSRITGPGASLQESGEVPDMPLLGSRLMRGTDLDVRWDNGHSGKYRYGPFDVKVVRDRPGTNSSQSGISTGCEVIRGPDWSFGMQDGGPGGVGVVVADRQEGILLVKWRRNGYINVYKCGNEGKVEVIPRDWEQSQFTDDSSTATLPQSQPQSHTQPNLQLKEQLFPQREKSSENVGVPRGDVPSIATNLLQQPTDIAALGVGTSSRTPGRIIETGSFQQSASTPSQGPLSEAGQSDNHCIWSWLDDNGQWVPYSEENVEVLDRCYKLRKDGSCLLRKSSQRFRVLFKTMTEKCLDDNTRRKVRRTGKE